MWQSGGSMFQAQGREASREALQWMTGNRMAGAELGAGES